MKKPKSFLKTLSLLLLLSFLPVRSLACEIVDGYPCTEEVMAMGYKDKHAKKDAAKFQREIERGRLREKTNTALDAIIRSAAYHLERHGYYREADKMRREWNMRYYGQFIWALGDHAPLSLWLEKQHAMMEILLGESACRFLRIHDMHTINHALPVLFACIDNVDVGEYFNHLSPFLGVVGFWTSYSACGGATLGFGLVSLICGPIAMGFEYAAASFVAPAVNQSLWRLACHKP